MAAGLRPVRGQPGKFVVAGTNEVITILEYRDDIVYDTVNVQTGTTSTTFNNELLFFDNLANKKKRDTNFLQAHKIPQNWEVIIMKLGIYAHMVTGNTAWTPLDLKKIYENASLYVDVNEQPIADGWCMGYQTGMGLAGQTMETGQGIVSLGTPSVAAAPTLLVPQKLINDHYVGGKLKFDDVSLWPTTVFTAGSLSAGGDVKLIFKGFVKRTTTK